MSHSSLPESIELYIFKACPFAQRVQMSLIHSQLPYKTIVLTPGEMPDDFTAISPLGNVPVLRINNSETLFESAVITDYIAQISAVSMEPEDELKRAQMRAWSEYFNSCFDALMAVLQASDKDSFEQTNKVLINKFQPLENILPSDGPFFYGEKMMTIDCAYAPLFLRMKTLHELYPAFSLNGLPENSQHWMDSLLACDVLKKSIMGDFHAIFRMFISKMATDKYIDRQLALSQT